MRAVMALARDIVVLHHGEIIARAIANLDLYYGDAQALADVTLAVPEGEIVCSSSRTSRRRSSSRSTRTSLRTAAS